jgi:hypothetical protein
MRTYVNAHLNFDSDPEIRVEEIPNENGVLCLTIGEVAIFAEKEQLLAIREAIDQHIETGSHPMKAMAS